MNRKNKLISLILSIAILLFVFLNGWLSVPEELTSFNQGLASLIAEFQGLTGLSNPRLDVKDQTVENYLKKLSVDRRGFGKGFHFDGERAYMDAEIQVSFGPRIPGSQAHAQTVGYIRDELEGAGWQVELQESIALGHEITNVVGKRGSNGPLLILGAHFDTRMVSNNDPDLSKRSLPVPGANDGASGVAVLLELARVLPDDFEGQIWLVFFDAEDNGRIEGWDWILGSQAFVVELEEKPAAVVIVDMVGDADLNIYMEQNSDPDMAASIWQAASNLGYQQVFIPERKHGLLDDHSPFLRSGIPAALIIDFDYPYWHTTEDTMDKISPDSLQVVGDTLLNWLLFRAKLTP